MEKTISVLVITPINNKLCMQKPEFIEALIDTKMRIVMKANLEMVYMQE